MVTPIIKEYQKEDIYIVWNQSKCIHCGHCARELSSVFKPKDKPWISPEGAWKQAIIDQVEKCPSGALTIRT